jgi:hypothetical protein
VLGIPIGVRREREREKERERERERERDVGKCWEYHWNFF